ncbi:hypothetical protein KUS29_002673 [Escherichia coli]|nr:hypothetical protein [Escherichia coli]EHR8694530.1 hypothetical protein [Escherichia coli]
MSDEVKIKSLSPAVPGWWAKFIDTDDWSAWYSPIAAWALCDVKFSGGHTTHQMVLPLLTGEMGMEPISPEEGNYSCLYLPDKKFALSDEPGSFALYSVDESSGHETTSKNDGAKHD